jgi:hypothetical protein
LAPPPPPTHRLKHVQLPGGRSVPVVMQSENGPCPLLAIANVLLLRGNIYLPPGASEVTQVFRKLLLGEVHLRATCCRVYQHRSRVAQLSQRSQNTTARQCLGHPHLQLMAWLASLY